jgi:hypothetical protein
MQNEKRKMSNAEVGALDFAFCIEHFAFCIVFLPSVTSVPLW